MNLKSPTCDRCGTGFYIIYSDTENFCMNCRTHLQEVETITKKALPLINWINTGNAKLQSDLPE